MTLPPTKSQAACALPKSRQPRRAWPSPPPLCRPATGSLDRRAIEPPQSSGQRGANTSTYAYATAGNPTTLANGATLAYDAANQPTQFTLGGTTTAITHDNQGNRLTGPAPTIGTSTYTWNQANRLATANGTSFA